jgi:hypothetical protein
MKHGGRFVAFFLALMASWGLWTSQVPEPPLTPTPTASVTPVSTVEPTVPPTPSPAQTPTPGCALGPSTGRCEDRPSDASWFIEAVSHAQEHAAIRFVRDGHVINEAQYTNEVARLLREQGYCAINGHEAGHTSDDEVWVKNVNQRSEHFDIVTGDGSPWTHYAAKCVPAAF